MRSFLAFLTELNEVVLVHSGTLKIITFKASFSQNFSSYSKVIFSVTTDNLLLILLMIDLLVTSEYVINIFSKFLKLVDEFIFEIHKAVL